MLAADKLYIFVGYDGVVERVLADPAVYAPPPVEAGSRQPEQLMLTETDLRAKSQDGP